MFTKATKKQTKARVGLVGPSGSGKTYTSLLIAKGLGGRIALGDSENRSASKYAGEPGIPEFDVCELTSFSPKAYIDLIRGAAREGYDVLILDSLSHAWTGKGGALDLVDQATARSRSKNAFTEGWREVTPLHNEMIDAIVRAPIHVIATMRAHTEYVIDEDENGRKAPRKVGLAPVQRKGMDYEFDLVADMDVDNKMIVGKTRCSALRRAVISCPTEALGKQLAAWLSDGAPSDVVGREELTRIQDLIAASGVSYEATILQRAGVLRLEDLPAEKAPKVIEWLESRAPKRPEPAAPVVAEPVETSTEIAAQ